MHTEEEIFKKSFSRITSLFQLEKNQISLADRFGEELTSSFTSSIKYNELDQLLHDIQDVADRQARKELDSGSLEI